MNIVEKHAVARTRFDLGWRTLKVADKRLLTPHMLRVEFSCLELNGFTSPSPDDHVKLLFHAPSGEKVMRDFTPRAWSETEGAFAL